MPLTREHLLALDDVELPELLSDFAFCALAGDLPIAAGGLIPAWEAWGYAWFTRGHGFPRRYWPGITRAVAKSLELAFEQGLYPYIAMTIYADNAPALRWAKRLGFEPAEPVRMNDGSPGWVYVRAA